MTPRALSLLALPYARAALHEAKPEVRDAVGRAGWFVLWPAWSVVAGPLLPILVRIAVELAVGLLAPWLLPLFLALEGMAHSEGGPLSEAVSLLRTPHAELSGAVRTAMRGPTL